MRRVQNTAVHVAGLALLFTAAGMAVSGVVELVDGGDDAPALFASALITAGAGLVMWRGTRVPERITAAGAFAAATWTWILVSVAGAVPFLLVGTFDRPDDALFEAISGFTAAGASVLSPIEGNGAGILFWRSFTQWYGGMGMVVLAVSVLPFLGVGGLELLRAEAPGPTSDRLAPRVSGTATRLWVVYSVITTLAIGGLLVVGLSPYDAAVHAFTAVSTGGFSPYDASVGHFASQAVEIVLIVAMVAGATNFTLHWRAAQGDLGAYWRMPEFRLFVGLIASGVAFVAVLNALHGMAWGTAWRDSAFTVVSVGTTTGFGTADFVQWVPAAQILLLFLMVSGSMTGSTSGAVKLLRLQVLGRYATRELRRARHRRGTFRVKIGGVPVPESTVGRIAGFMVLYLLILVAGVFALTSLRTDLVTALGVAATSMGGVGPGLGDAGPASNFLVLTRPARGISAALMLLGRLEIFPMLLMFAAPLRAMRRRRPPLERVEHV